MSPKLDPGQQRAFALEIVRKLRDAGYEALWAGGCVRDFLLGYTPKDYDVATNATPETVRRVLRGYRTLSIGAAFGVIAVVGRGGAGTVEVATFRSDVSYTDGRHPDAVVFSDARHDALRRDFTVNGLFYDPIAEQVIDYVEGQADLEHRLLRAIGVPRDRFAEDKLRMLRGVRIATQFDLTIEQETLAAIQQMARQILDVSAERIGQEMRGLLLAHHCRRGLELLVDSQLAAVVWPELLAMPSRPSPVVGLSNAWAAALAVVECVETPTLPMILAIVVWLAHDKPVELIEELAHRWRYSNDIRDTAGWLAEHATALDDAQNTAWSQIQPLLIHPAAKELIQLHAARFAVEQRDDEALDYCRQRLAWPREQLDPPPLLSGHDLAALHLPKGPLYAKLLTRLRAAQLDGQVTDRPQAEQAVVQWARELTGADRG